MKVLVCGGRDYGDRNAVYEALRLLHKRSRLRLVIQGGHPGGADRMASDWASLRCVPCLRHPPDWDRLGKAAGPARNRAMLRWKPDAVLWFPGGSGTEGMKALAEKAGVPLIDGEALAHGQV